MNRRAAYFRLSKLVLYQQELERQVREVQIKIERIIDGMRVADKTKPKRGAIRKPAKKRRSTKSRS